MRHRRISFFIFGLVASAALGAAASDPTSLMIRVPPKLAAQIAQQSLGQPAPNGESRIEIEVKKPIEAVVRNINISKLGEVARVYLAGIFGLNLDTPFQLPLIVKGIKIAGTMRVRDIRFTQPRERDPRRLGVTVQIDIPNVVVDADEIWAHELGLTPEQTDPGTDCPRTPMVRRFGGNTARAREFERFVGNHIWARDLAPQVRKKKEFRQSEKAVIHATGKFGAEIVREPGVEPRLEVYPLSIDVGNLQSVLSDYYELDEGTLLLPEVMIRVGEKCYPGDPSGVQAIFHSLRETLKQEIVKGVIKDIKKAALEEARKALASLDIPAAKGYEFRADPPALAFATAIQPTYIDHTYVHRDNRFLSIDLPKAIPVGDTPVRKKNPAPLAGVLWEINERLSAEAISVGRDGALELGLSDALRINGRDQSRVESYEFGDLPVQASNALRIVIGRAFFEAKTDLVAALRSEQTALLPREIDLGPEGIVLHPSKSGKLSLVAHVRVHLRKLTGLKKAIYYLDRLAGNKSGILEIPAQLDVEPSIVGTGDARRLTIKFVVNTNILRNEFGESSKLGKLFPRVTELLPVVAEKVNQKIAEAAKKLNENPLEIDLAPLESKSPLRIENVFFTGAGSLVADVTAPNLPAFVKAAKEKKRERKARENNRE